MTGEIEKLISGMIDDRGMTLADFTAQLGYQSKTSLVRIMKGQVSQRAIDTFAKRMRSSIDLTAQEELKLSEVIDHLRWRQDYISSREMLRFLRGEQTPEEDIWLEVQETGTRMRFSDRYARTSEISITLLNSQYVPIFRQLLKLVRDRGAAVEHFLQMSRESVRVIHAIGELIPLIYEKGYAGYCSCHVDGSASGGVRGMLDADVMVIRYRREDGVSCEDIIVFNEKNHGFVSCGREPGRYRGMLGIRYDQYKPIKNVYFQSSRMDSYVQFCEAYAKLEHNRSIYKIKPDLCMSWIPEDIIVSALMDGRVGEMEGVSELLEHFREVYHERVRNVYEKRRVSKAIMKRSAMVRFARTGRLADHFWAMRPFTPGERVRIFRLLLEQNENNPYFNVFFLKDNDFLRDVEVAHFENTGILMMDPSTDYAMQGNHSEVMIVHDEFMRMFRDYFERSLLADHVLNHAETIDFLNSLIRIAADS